MATFAGDAVGDLGGAGVCSGQLCMLRVRSCLRIQPRLLSRPVVRLPAVNSRKMSDIKEGDKASWNWGSKEIGPGMLPSPPSTSMQHSAPLCMSFRHTQPSNELLGNFHLRVWVCNLVRVVDRVPSMVFLRTPIYLAMP